MTPRRRVAGEGAAAGVALFRASASPATGGGHVVRCMALAQELAARGWRCLFASGLETTGAVSGLKAAFPVIEVAEAEAPQEGADALGAALARRGIAAPVDAFVLDHYGLGIAFERAVRPLARKLLVIDDLPSRPHACDLLLDQSGGRDPADYRALVPVGCRVLAGPRFALLRPAFRRGPGRPPGASARRAIRRIVVAMGATDAADLTSVAVGAARAAVPEARIDVILAGAAPHLERLRARFAADPNVAVNVDVADVAGLLEGADLAVGTAGIGLWERCALGVPSIIVIAAENQRLNARHVEARAGGIIAGEAGAVLELAIARRLGERIAALLGELATDPGRLHALAKAARAVCDGRGPRRVADALVKSISG